MNQGNNLKGSADIESNHDSSTLLVHLSDYYFVGDGRHFDKHFFIIKVTAETFKYTVDRSYVDFVEFDRLIRKKFPESNIHKLPLEEVRVVKRVLLTAGPATKSALGAGMLTSTRNSLVYPGAGVGSSASENVALFLIPEGSIEDIGSKRYALDKYLQDLLVKPEILGSDELLRFLDEEVRSVAVQEDPEEPLSVHDLLLINVAVNKCVVHRNEEYQYHIPRGHLILWRFSTLYYDIGFSVEMNGAVKVPYTRFSSHKAAVCGALEATDPSICILKWDNSYAKCKITVLLFFFVCFIII